MKKETGLEIEDELRPEYDLTELLKAHRSVIKKLRQTHVRGSRRSGSFAGARWPANEPLQLTGLAASIPTVPRLRR